MCDKIPLTGFGSVNNISATLSRPIVGSDESCDRAVKLVGS